MDRARLERAAGMFAALAHPARLHILALLVEREPRSVGELVEATGVERTLLSHQLRTLRESRLVTQQPRGRQRLYGLADAHVRRLVGAALEHTAEVE